MKTIIPLSYKQFCRELCRGYYTLWLAALIIATGLVTSIQFIKQRIDAGTQQQAQQFMGADVVITTPTITAEWISKAQHMHLQTATRLTFDSMLLANQEFQLASVTAVTKNYPLKGDITVTDDPQLLTSRSTKGPAVGQIWLAPRLANSLHIHPGDMVTIGETQLTFSHYLLDYPGRRTVWLSIAPGALMHLNDIAKTAIVQPGSRIQRQLLLSGNAQTLQQYLNWLKPQLTSAAKITQSQTDTNLQNALDKAYQYLESLNIFVILFAGLAIILASQLYSRQQLTQCALLRCYGAKQRDIIIYYGIILLLLALIACVLGSLLGYLTQHILVMIIRPFIPYALPHLVLTPIIQALFFAILLLVCFSLASIIAMRNTPILQLLNRKQHQHSLFSYAMLASSLLGTSLLIYWQTQQILLTIKLVLVLTIAISILAVCAYALLKSLKYLYPRCRFPTNYALHGLTKHYAMNILQIVAISIITTAVISITVTREDLLAAWENKTPAHAPNYFVINLLQRDLEPFAKMLDSQAIPHAKFYPIVRARLVERNGRPIAEQLTEKQAQARALHRDLNLSWSQHLPVENQIVSGHWWKPSDNNQALVSIEQGLAQRLGIELGDTLGFSQAGKIITVTVASMRHLEWESFTPNFYFLFPPDFLNDYPHTYITSLYISKQKVNAINGLIQAFPAISFIDISELLSQFRSIIRYISLILQYVIAFALCAAVLILIITAKINWQNQIQELTILRLLGASNAQLKKIIFIRYVSLAVMSSLFSIAMAITIAKLITQYLLNVPYHFNFMLLIFGIGFAMIFFLLPAYFYRFCLLKQTRLSNKSVT